MSSEFKLSVSKSKTFIDCKAKYNYIYNLKMPRKEFEYHTFGKFCHKVLEDFHGVYIAGSKVPLHLEMSKAFKNAVEEYKDKMTPEMKKECYELINKYLKNISNKGNKIASNVIAVEKNFSFNVADNIILNGMIDRIQIDSDNVLHVADYKTTKNKKYLKDDWFQLLTYAYIMISEDPSIQKVRASYVLLRHDFEYITKEFSVPEILTIKQKYIDYANQINTEKDWAPNPTVLCNWCEFQEMCPEGKTKAFNKPIYGEVAW